MALWVIRMRIPGIYCGSIFAGTMGTHNLAINRPTQIFRHLRYFIQEFNIHSGGISVAVHVLFQQ